VKQNTRSYFAVGSCIQACICTLFCETVAFAAENIDYSNRRSYPISVEPFFTAGIALGDIDGDGDLDMVESNGRHWAQASYVYFNSENRGLTKRMQLGAYERTAYTVELADMDGDGDLDVVQASDKQENQIYLNDGTGHFGPAHLFGDVQSNTRSIEIADVDADGDLDILEVCRGTPNLLFLNDGAGNFPGMEQSDVALPVTFGELSDRTLSVKVADMNEDGLVDLILANRDGGQNKILLGRANLQFGSTIPFGSGEDDTRGLVVVDMNDDGRPDIVTSNIGEANGVILNKGNGVFDQIQRFGSDTGRSYAILAHDLDGDEDMDIVVANVGDKNRVFLNDGVGKLSLLSEFGLAEHNTYALGIGDINGDGLPDIIAGNSDDANIVYFQSIRDVK
jgi:hypothetical protein